MGDIQGMLDMFQLFVCAWMIYGGIMNRGAMYKDDTIHKTKKEEFHKFMRKFCLTAGPLGVAGAVVNMLGYKTAGAVLLVLLIVYVIAFGVISYRFGDEYIKKQSAKNNSKK